MDKDTQTTQPSLFDLNSLDTITVGTDFPDDFYINSSTTANILLSDHHGKPHWSYPNIPPLTTAQLASLNTISIQPLTTGINTTITNNGTDPFSYGRIDNSLQVNGDITLNGKSLKNTIEGIEDKLAILHPSPELEEKWEKLRELRKQYIQCEKEIREAEKIWETLKK
ncbi:hypothetical protein EBU94_08285 [bacterium]|nr:hypothetical protein [bacterium]